MGNVLMILVVIAGTYYWIYLLPAIENDRTLEWNEHATTLVTTGASAAEAAGTLLLGPLGDKTSAIVVFTAHGVLMCTVILWELLSSRVSMLVSGIMLVCTAKGLLWPTICAVTGAGSTREGFDKSFLACALASRTSEACTALFLGLLIGQGHLNWRVAGFVLLGGIVLLLSCALALYPKRTALPMEDADELPIDTAELELRTKIWRLVCSLDAWLCWISLVTASCIWALGSYVPLLLQDMYHVDSGKASKLTAVCPAAMMLGLTLATMSSSQLGVHAGRVVHVLQIFVGAFALGLLAVWPDSQPLPIYGHVGLISLGFFGAVVPCYLPSLVYAASSPPSERAFRSAVIWSTTQFVGIFITYGYGRWREGNDAAYEQARLMYRTTAVCLAVSSVITGCFYWRIFDGESTKSSPIDHGMN
jgi:hypothetical protein